MVQFVRISRTIFADQNQLIARRLEAVFEIRSLALTVYTLAYGCRIVRKSHGHALVENSQCSFPQTIVALSFAVLDYASVYLVNIFEAALFHHGTDHFAAHAASTISHNFLVFDIVVFVTL